jgi:hypothetical protein
MANAWSKQQGVATSALCECGGGAPRRWALRGPCCKSNPPRKKRKELPPVRCVGAGAGRCGGGLCAGSAVRATPQAPPGKIKGGAWPSCLQAGTHTKHGQHIGKAQIRRLPPVRCASAGAERRGGGLCAGPAAKKRKELPPVRCASAGAERPKCGFRAGPAYVVKKKKKSAS